MVSLEKIREDLQRRYDIDSNLHNVEVNAQTVDEALADASVQLDVKEGLLQYEVIEKGSNGFLGIGKKPWKLKIYQNPDTIVKKKIVNGVEVIDNGESEEAVIESHDGLFYVRRFGYAINLKVVLPIGEGHPVDKKDVIDQVKRDDTDSFDEKLIEKLIKNGTDGKYKEIGSFKHNPAGDATISVDISKDEMHGMITVDAPAMGGADISHDDIINAFRTQQVYDGIDEKKVDDFVDNPVYSTPVEVASAILPVDGKDSYLSYKFETDPDKLKAKESDKGNINFKELNQIQNVVKGQVLATRILATRGVAGKTLRGTYLEAKNGKDIPITLGQNAEMDGDQVSVIASIDGQVLLVAGRITVEPVLNLDAVNIKSGNVNFLGTVIIRGNIEDGFSVKASGDIDVGGTVGKSQVESDGNIIIHQGIFGKGEGSIKCGKSLWMKFAQDMKIDVEENLIATDSLLNCEVVAMKNIVVYGKKAQITGGHLSATEEICAKTIGSAGGSTHTILSVGVDPRAKAELDNQRARQSELLKELESVELDISTLENQKKMRRTLPKDKQDNLNKLNDRKVEIEDETKAINTKIAELNDHLNDLKAVGKVKVEGTAYAGTKIFVRDVLDDLKAEVKACTFYYEDSFAKRGKYEPPSLDVSKGPEGYD